MVGLGLEEDDFHDHHSCDTCSTLVDSSASSSSRSPSPDSGLGESVQKIIPEFKVGVKRTEFVPPGQEIMDALLGASIPDERSAELMMDFGALPQVLLHETDVKMEDALFAVSPKIIIRPADHWKKWTTRLFMQIDDGTVSSSSLGDAFLPEEEVSESTKLFHEDDENGRYEGDPERGKVTRGADGSVKFQLGTTTFKFSQISCSIVKLKDPSVQKALAPPSKPDLKNPFYKEMCGLYEERGVILDLEDREDKKKEFGEDAIDKPDLPTLSFIDDNEDPIARVLKQVKLKPRRGRPVGSTKNKTALDPDKEPKKKEPKPKSQTLNKTKSNFKEKGSNKGSPRDKTKIPKKRKSDQSGIPKETEHKKPKIPNGIREPVKRKLSFANLGVPRQSEPLTNNLPTPKPIVAVIKPQIPEKYLKPNFSAGTTSNYSLPSKPIQIMESNSKSPSSSPERQPKQPKLNSMPLLDLDTPRNKYSGPSSSSPPQIRIITSNSSPPKFNSMSSPKLNSMSSPKLNSMSSPKLNSMSSPKLNSMSSSKLNSMSPPRPPAIIPPMTNYSLPHPSLPKMRGPRALSVRPQQPIVNPIRPVEVRKKLSAAVINGFTIPKKKPIPIVQNEKPKESENANGIPRIEPEPPNGKFGSSSPTNGRLKGHHELNSLDLPDELLYMNPSAGDPPADTDPNSKNASKTPTVAPNPTVNGTMTKNPVESIDSLGSLNFSDLLDDDNDRDILSLAVDEDDSWLNN